MGVRGGSAVGAVVVAPGTSGSVGRVLGIAMSKVGGTRYNVQFCRLRKITPKNRVLLYTEYIRRCSLVLSASSAASAFLLLLLLLLATAAAASAAAAAATALRTAGWLSLIHI